MRRKRRFGILLRCFLTSPPILALPSSSFVALERQAAMASSSERLITLRHLSPGPTNRSGSSNATPAPRLTPPSSDALLPLRSSPARPHTARNLDPPPKLFHHGPHDPSVSSPAPHPLRLALLFIRVSACVLSIGLLSIVGTLLAAHRREGEVGPPGLHYVIAAVSPENTSLLPTRLQLTECPQVGYHLPGKHISDLSYRRIEGQDPAAPRLGTAGGL